ncbi:MAG: ABC transporter permease [Pseudomonadota bacterium]
MNLVDTLLAALRSLRANRLRSALTTLGIVIGIAAVIAMLAVGEGAKRRVADEMKSLGSNLLLVMPGTVTSGGVRLGGGVSRNSLTEADVQAIRDEIPGAIAVSGTLRGSGQAVFGNLNWSTQLYGIDADYLIARDWVVERGRAFDDNELRGKAKVALVGQTVAEMLFGGTDPTGQTLRVKGIPLTIVGLLGTKGQNVMGQDQDDIILIPLGTARGRILGQGMARPDNVGSITVKMADGSDMAGAEEQVRALIRQKHRIQPGQDDDFNLRNLSEIVQAEQAASGALSALLAAIGSVSLIVGGIGIMNIMLVSVTERTREIGIRLAIGARRRDILTQFMVEAVTLSVLGGLVGVGLGIGGGLLVERLLDWPVLFRPEAVLLAVVSASAVGIFFGWYPARKASRLTPVEALRHD